MHILFSHQNFPGQFGGLGKYLAENGWSVTFVTAKDPLPHTSWCRLIQMKPHRGATERVHRFALNFEKAMINGQAFANACIKARAQGLNPDIVVAHSGWGSGTFAKSVWPECKFAAYVEWYYNWPPVDSTGLDDAKNLEDGRARALARNAPVLVDMSEADLIFCPSLFQTAQFPENLRRDIVTLPDGVDCTVNVPQAGMRPPLPEGRSIPEGSEIVTYATRGMEPHRGFPEFMRAIAELQRSRPNLHVVIGGENRVAYGPKLPKGESWKKRMLDELDLDLERIHFTGLLPRPEYLRLLQSSDLHVYLTVPFVLSWSLIEAMSVGCALLASDTAPVREALRHGDTAELVDHTDPGALARALERLLNDPAKRDTYGQRARQAAIRRFDSNWIYPARAQILESKIREG
ncbi:MAG: glycosyltransferase [Pseudomonadota bacterium]